jgi:hypothetical protein
LKRHFAFVIVSVAFGVLSITACGVDRTPLTTAPSVAAPSSARAVPFAEAMSASSVHESATTGATPTSRPATPVSGEAAVTTVDSATSCPTLTFRLGTYSIATSAATIYDGGTCANIKAGAKIRLTGTKADATIQATTIQFKSTGSETPTVDNVDGEGVIASLRSGTSCPALTFMIESYAITVGATTTFDSGACADLRAGLRVHVKGARNGGGVTATRIVIQHEAPQQDAEGEGVVTSVVAGSACPALKFMIGEYTVAANATTQFPTASCGAIAAGKKVNVKGSLTGVKTVTAARIIVKS